MARRHGVNQRAIRDVNGGVANGEQQIGTEGPGNFYAHAGIGHGKGQHADNRNGNRNPQLPWAKAPPAAAGTVCDHAHNRVGNCIKNAKYHKERTNDRGRQAKNVGVEKGEKVADETGNDGAACIAKAVADFLPNG